MKMSGGDNIHKSESVPDLCYALLTPHPKQLAYSVKVLSFWQRLKDRNAAVCWVCSESKCNVS